MTEVFVPADVPNELIETYLENMNQATQGTGMMNLFACDQKIEHLNDDFYDGGKEIPLTSNDPGHLFEIGLRAYEEGHIGVLAGQCGLISHYARDAPDVPYLVKLNSKTNVVKTAQKDPVSLAMWNMDDVMSLVSNGINVVGIGYTVYLGSEFENEMLTEAATFIREAHDQGMIAVVWMYPRGQAVSNEKDPQLISGAAGVAACIGAGGIGRRSRLFLLLLLLPPPPLLCAVRLNEIQHALRDRSYVVALLLIAGTHGAQPSPVSCWGRWRGRCTGRATSLPLPSPLLLPVPQSQLAIGRHAHDLLEHLERRQAELAPAGSGGCENRTRR